MKTKNLNKQSTSKFISRENKRSFNDALQTARDIGLPFQKIWIMSVYYVHGIPKVCHPKYEQLEYVNMDYEYAPGLKFPCDPDCQEPNETNDCRCSIGFKVLETKFIHFT